MLNTIKDIPFLQFAFWLRNPGVGSISELILLLGIFFVIVVLGIAFLVYNRIVVGHYPPKNKIFRPLAVGLLILGSLGAIFSLFRWQGIDFLGVRAFELVFVLISAGWVAFFLDQYRRNIPQQSIEYEAKMIKKKYLAK
ncbi:MAG: hypothetical protein WD187_03110 [Candidatus Woykebacteria bacterium]